MPTADLSYVVGLVAMSAPDGGKMLPIAHAFPYDGGAPRPWPGARTQIKYKGRVPGCLGVLQLQNKRACNFRITAGGRSRLRIFAHTERLTLIEIGHSSQTPPT